MNIIDVSSNLIFFHAEDGRYIFRPWGKFGSCYQVNEKQRFIRAIANLLYYFLLLGTIIHYATSGLFNEKLIIAFILFMVFHQFLLWLYTFGLTKTEVPERPSEQYRQEVRKNHAKAMGRPFLWFGFICALAMVVSGVLVGLILGELLTSFISVTFFGICAVIIFKKLQRLKN